VATAPQQKDTIPRGEEQDVKRSDRKSARRQVTSGFSLVVGLGAFFVAAGAPPWAWI